MNQGRSRFDARISSRGAGLIHPQQILCKRGRQTPVRNGLKAFAVIGHQIAKGSGAQMHRLIEHRIEDRRKFARRRIDDLKNLGSGGLLVQCLAGLGQEPRILHRDHCLSGKVFEQCDLFVREGPYF